MAIKKIKGLESEFSIIPNSTVNDSLSWGAKGLLAYLCSKPDDWSVSVQQLCNHSKQSSKPTGRDGTYTLINELISKGYMKRVQSRETGKFASAEYIVSVSPLTDSPHTDKADTAEPFTANPTLQSKEINKGQIDTKKSINTSDSRFSEFWNLYDKKVDSKKCEAKFNKLSKKDIEIIFEKLPAYVKSTPDKQYRKNPLTWLNGKCWNDEIQQRMDLDGQPLSLGNSGDWHLEPNNLPDY